MSRDLERILLARANEQVAAVTTDELNRNERHLPALLTPEERRLRLNARKLASKRRRAGLGEATS